jgi:hypothetical protein
MQSGANLILKPTVYGRWCPILRLDDNALEVATARRRPATPKHHDRLVHQSRQKSLNRFGAKAV